LVSEEASEVLLALPSTLMGAIGPNFSLRELIGDWGS